jgi:hypothetical protein
MQTSNVTARRPNLSSKGREPRTRKLTGVTGVSRAERNWWELPTDKVGGAIRNLVNRIDQTNAGYRQRMMRFARMYGSYENLGLTNSFNYSVSNTQTNNLPTYNIVQSMVDTLGSKITRDNPAPYFITSGADYFEKLRAEKQTQFVQGGFYEMGLYDLANNKTFRDSAVYGLGAVQFEYQNWTDDKKITCDWVFIDELKLDPFDSARGLPRSLHRTRMVQKELLLARFGKDEEKAKWIEEAATNAQNQMQSIDTVIDWVVYVETWHLANGKDNPGRHIISIGDRVLLDEEYEYEDYSGCMAFFQYYQKPVGMLGRGIAETIQSGQFEINKILLAIQQGQELQARPVIIVDQDSKISNDSILNNRIARLIKVKSGSRQPVFLTPTAMAPEVYQHLESWMNWCREEVGVTQTSQTGAIRAGIDSAVAMREQVDIESTRYVQVAKNWEKFFIDCAHVYMKLGKKAYDEDKTFSVRYYDKKYKVLREIPWSKIATEEDGYVIQCDTVSAFPKSAAGRIQTVTDFISNNFISRDRGMELLGVDPDLESEVKLATSTLRLLEKTLSAMVEDGKYEHPEPYMNLEVAQLVSEQTYCMLKTEGCPEDRLQLVRQWISEIVVLKGGVDPMVALLQSVFAQPAAPANGAPIAPQAGLAPANVAAQAA